MVLHLPPNQTKAMGYKFKFKITDDTKLENALSALEDLGKANITEIPFNHICKILEFIGAELQKNTTGSQKRFYHPDCPTFGGYFGVHIIHKGKDDVSVAKQNFKTYILPIAREIIEILIERRKA